MQTYPVVLTIAGSDSGGGAGIQADLKTISALGAFGTSAITAITVQNTLGVRAIHSVPFDILEGQIDAVMSDFDIKAVKIGMVNHPALGDIIAQAIRKYKPAYVVLDPVMVATSGDILIQEQAIEQIKTQLFPLSDVITPNLSEASILLGRTISNQSEMEEAAKALACWGSRSVLIKGGHLNDDEMTDILWIGEEKQIHRFSASRVLTNNLHGTGCSLSSAIATFLAFREPLVMAVQHAKEYITQAIDAGQDVKIGHGNGAVNHFFNPQKLKIIDIE